MAKQVKGTLFVDYVRMVKSRKDVDWSKYLNEQDMKILDELGRVLPSSWYPFDTFERMGIGAFHEIGGGDLEAIRRWGQVSTDQLVKVYKGLVQPGDPIGSAEKFNVFRAGFFSFPGVELELFPDDNKIKLYVFFSQNEQAAEAQAFQAFGAIERLIDLAGARDIKHTFVARIWDGAPKTILEITWN